MQKQNIFKGVASVSALLASLVMGASVFAFKNEGMVNQMLNVTTSKIIQSDDAELVDTYTNDFGTDIDNKTTCLELEMAVADENITQAEEGTVLLRNEKQALPLAKDSKVTIFGNGAYHSRYNKSKEDSGIDSITVVDFPTAMEDAFGKNNVNALTDVYSSLGTTSNSSVVEADIESVKAKSSTFANYGDAAIVVLTRYGTEDSETNMYVDGERYLGLQKNEKDLLAYLKEQKAANVFKKIVVVLNMDQMMELGWAADYDVDSILLAGIPGIKGFEGVGHVMNGEVNPSGHTVDTIATNSLSAPADVYAGTENTKTWANVDEVNAAFAGYTPTTTEKHVDYFNIYAEGIYVGYKYYETRYMDQVTGNGNATGSNGATTGSSWNYSSEVTYPFGYGLSYGAEDGNPYVQEIESVNYDSDTDSYTVKVKVTNNGTVDGRSVVQVYAQTPYDTYEKENHIEKAAVNLVGFNKTEVIKAGQSTEIDVNVERYFLASYDSEKAKGYILSQGDYYLAIGNSSHDALNNILAASGHANGLINTLGQSATGNTDCVFSWNQPELDTTSYKYNRYRDDDLDEKVEVTNQFDDDQLAYYGVNFTYLSRSDWQGTYPTARIELNATADMIQDLKSDWYSTPSDAPAVSSFTQGADVTLKFADMYGVSYNDTEKWNTFLNQWTVDEMLTLKADSNGCGAIERMVMPAQARGDDGVCIQQGSLKAFGVHGLSWVSEVITSRTWNPERMKQRGRMLGEEAVFCDLNELWYGGGNIHRTQYGGRNMQYYSEDGNFGYMSGALEAAAMQEVGIIYGVKHFALNDQEAYRESLATFANEQTIREIYLRPFEGVIGEGKSMGMMTGFNRIGCDYVATNKNLCTDVLRKEWSFKGHLTTDAGDSSYKAHQVCQLMAGIDYTCWNTKYDEIQAACQTDGAVLEALRNATKNNVYAAVHSVNVNKLTSGTTVINITPAWKIAISWAFLGAAILGGLSLVGYVVLEVLDHKKEQN